MLYFGANDGALHGISACTGHERIAYVPNALFPTLSKLTSQQYQHQYYVDGASTVVDAFFDSGTDDSVASSHDDDEWHTVLIGSLRAGGKAVFALDVTDPADFLESNADDLVLWEKSNNDTDYAEMGYSYSQPAIVKTEHHGWVAIFGNGYHGASGKAVLYVARIHDGELLVAIDLSASGHGSGAHGSNNGLSTVAPIDRDRDGLVDLLYAGDRNGNVWRFDTRNSSGTATGFNRSQTTLLYSAKNKDGNAQSITSRMAVGYHPHSVAGRMVYFGTGKYYETTDQDPANAVVHNTMYGIWDRDNGPSGSGPTVTSVETRNSSVLQKQTIEYQDLNTFGTNVETIRVLSNTPVAWVGRQNNGTWNSCSAANGLCGWYLDLTDTGEKMVNTPILRGGRLIFVTTMPSPIACDEGGSGWLMEIDPATGGRLDIAAFDLDGDKIFDDDTATFTDGSGTQQTLPPSGKKSKVGILQPPAILAGIGGSGDGSFGGAEGKYSSGTKDAAIDVTIENPGGLTAGRKSWARIK
jgi:type IV pilus assembly protein PilY1